MNGHDVVLVYTPGDFGTLAKTEVCSSSVGGSTPSTLRRIRVAGASAGPEMPTSMNAMTEYMHTIAAEDAGKTLYFTCSYLPIDSYNHCRLGQTVVVTVLGDLVKLTTPKIAEPMDGVGDDDGEVGEGGSQVDAAWDGNAPGVGKVAENGGVEADVADGDAGDKVDRDPSASPPSSDGTNRKLMTSTVAIVVVLTIVVGGVLYVFLARSHLVVMDGLGPPTQHPSISLNLSFSPSVSLVVSGDPKGTARQPSLA